MVADGLEKISDLFDDIADRQIFAVYSHICIALINRNTFFVQGFQRNAYPSVFANTTPTVLLPTPGIPIKIMLFIIILHTPTTTRSG